jgi:hypothetical protein
MERGKSAPHCKVDVGKHSFTMNLFLIGNSFSQNATRYLPQLAVEGGHHLHIGRAEVGGCSLQRHWEHVEAAERGEEVGKFYTGKSLERDDNGDYRAKSLRELLTACEWDMVMFHQASLPSSNVDSYYPYAIYLFDYIKALCPNAEVVLHQTWAYRCDSPFWGEIGDGQNAKDQREMWEKSRAAYHTISERLGARLIPTGDAFWEVDSDPQWKYRPDAKFDLEHPVSPNLPDQTNTLHAGYYWSKEGQFSIDPKHTSEAGAYLGSLMWYGFLFGESPEKVTFVPPNVSVEFAAHLRKVAAKILQETVRPLATLV